MVRWAIMIRVDVILLVTYAIAAITSVGAVDQSIESNDVPRIRGGKSIIHDTADEFKSKSADDIDEQGSTHAHGNGPSHNEHINPQSTIRGRNFVVYDTSKNTLVEPLPEVQLEVTASLSEVDTNNYDFGRLVLHRKRLDGSVTRELNRMTQVTRRTKGKKTKKKSNLDVDIRYLESFLRSKQKKREEHELRRRTQVTSAKRQPEEKRGPEEHVVHKELERLLESSSDLSYVYTSIPTPSPEIFSVPTLCESIHCFIVDRSL